ncbi:MAG: type II toxin-antitoxin system VapC family toxin [Nostoc sp. NMS1]|uniref:type II toxin-antitoxin system VapC family toxin n=1 Tax=unclassified Nostoc TaxID=2593658 RepID=UPI0025E2C7F6|nr:MULTISPECIES: type II toxin-antitoxin system VapC family toxin [unclassified Nostoc]MBN3911131.1 type II toxin-antitoxin system VapC family toxin [Nostoc sp. NMS1]MBN3990221.1 type II toxin-antitoxin system VapC family toxin [Nostoc sp. NMS2]
MRYLLDTDHISFLQRRSGTEFLTLAAHIAQHQATDFAFSIVSFHEQVIGAHTFITRSQTPGDVVRGYTLLMEIIQGFSAAPILPFDAGAVTIFEGLRAQRVRIATMDLRIASIALSRSLVLLTRNTSDFSKVPNLMTQDWTV